MTNHAKIWSKANVDSVLSFLVEVVYLPFKKKGLTLQVEKLRNLCEISSNNSLEKSFILWDVLMKSGIIGTVYAKDEINLSMITPLNSDGK